MQRQDIKGCSHNRWRPFSSSNGFSQNESEWLRYGQKRSRTHEVQRENAGAALIGGGTLIGELTAYLDIQVEH